MYSFFNETSIELKLGKRAENKFKRTKKCWQNREDFSLDEETKIRDHCQLAAIFRRTANQSCNLSFQKGVPSFFLFFFLIISV